MPSAQHSIVGLSAHHAAAGAGNDALAVVADGDAADRRRIHRLGTQDAAGMAVRLDGWVVGKRRVNEKLVGVDWWVVAVDGLEWVNGYG